MEFVPISTSRETPAVLFDQTPASLEALLAEHGERAFRVRQVLDWVYRRSCASFEEMSDLSSGLRSWLTDRMVLYESRVATERRSTDGTHKLLLRWADGQTTECVLIPDGPRRTACVSTQVGCPVGCVFCASGLDGVRRNLTAGQIVEQAMRLARRVATAPGPLIGEGRPRAVEPAGRPLSAARLTNVVFMGLGEPLANYDATVAAVRTMNANWGMGIGARKITVSTVGLPKQMRQLADERLQINLALSVHAASDDLRAELIPWARAIPLAELVDACRYYFDRTHREVTLEYLLLGGVNDQPGHARALARLAKQMRSNVNLIRYNPVSGLGYERPTAAAAESFQRLLRAAGVNTHLRKSRGRDIDAACGQLRRQTETGWAGAAGVMARTT